MSEKLAKAARRNLRQQIGATAAGAVATAHESTKRLELAHQVLARQMLDFETTASRLVESRAVDRKAVEALREQVESAHARISDERTHRLKLADEQRAYVDRAVTELRGRVNYLGADVVELSARTMGFHWMAFWERLRWLFTGQLPTRAKGETNAPIAPYVARDAHEAAWTDLGRPNDAGPDSRYATTGEARAAGQRVMAKHGPSLARLAPKPQHLGAVGGE